MLCSFVLSVRFVILSICLLVLLVVIVTNLVTFGVGSLFLSLFFSLKVILYRLLFPPCFFFVGGLVTFRTSTTYLQMKNLCDVLTINSKYVFVCLFVCLCNN